MNTANHDTKIINGVLWAMTQGYENAPQGHAIVVGSPQSVVEQLLELREMAGSH